MKLIFLGDSFTFGFGIDKEYAIKNKIISNDKNFFESINNDPILFNQLNDFRINNNWTALISKELNLDFENLSSPGSGIEAIYCQFLKSESDIEGKKFYIIGLPVTLSARKLISSKDNFNYFEKDDFLKLFNTYSFKKESNDIDFFKKYFDENYFSIIFINYISSMINYFRNKKINFLFLPTWYQSIKKHLTLNNNKIINKYLQKFIFNEIEDQMDFFIDENGLNKLSCGHPDIKSQYIIKNFYLKYVENRILKN
jgi:hypothetical protein